MTEMRWTSNQIYIYIYLSACRYIYYYTRIIVLSKETVAWFFPLLFLLKNPYVPLIHLTPSITLEFTFLFVLECHALGSETTRNLIPQVFRSCRILFQGNLTLRDSIMWNIRPPLTRFLEIWKTKVTLYLLLYHHERGRVSMCICPRACELC
jgi:hypothetical protein